MTNHLLASPPTVIRLAMSGDLAECVDCFEGTGFPREMVAERLSKLIDTQRLWALHWEEGGICGTLGFDKAAFRHSLYIEMLGIKAEHRKQGLAWQLMDHAIVEARKCGMKRLIAAVPRDNKMMGAIAMSCAPRTRDGRMKRLRRKGEAFDFWMGRI